MSKKIKPYTRYTEEFKRDAVRLVEQEGVSAAQVARDLGVNVNSIHGWLRKHREDAGDEFRKIGVRRAQQHEPQRQLLVQRRS